jgi:hypothetical protein
MKKMMLLAAMMVGTASAQTTAATGAIQFSTLVNNVCGLSNNAGGGSAAALPAGGTQAGTVNATQSSYDALQSNPGSSSFGPIGYLQCTTGTPLTLDVTTTTGASNTTAGTPSSATVVASNSMNLVSDANDTLAGAYKATLSKTATGNNGDVWQGAFSFTPTSGQWNSPAGLYKGTINFTVTYN